MIDVQLLPLHEYVRVLVLLLFDTNAMLVPDQLVFLLFRIRDSFWAAADSFDAILDAFVDSLRRVIASAHFLYSILFLAHRCAPLPSTFLPPENPATDTTLPPFPGPSLA